MTLTLVKGSPVDSEARATFIRGHETRRIGAVTQTWQGSDDA